MNEENTNWDEELENLTTLESAEDARLEIVIGKLEAVMDKWSDTVVYATVPDDAMDIENGTMEVRTEAFEDSFKTCLGDIAAVPMLGIIAQVLAEIIDSEDKHDIDQLRKSRLRIVEAVKALMIEGILISKSPDWSNEFEDATKGLVS